MTASYEESSLATFDRKGHKSSRTNLLNSHNIGYADFTVMMQAFNGAGDTITPTIVNFFGFWFLEIPLAYWLAIPLHMKSNGAFFAIAIAESSMAIASAILFKQGRWKKQEI